MNRRGFLSLLGMTVAGVALDQAIPFNRVWSFPKDIAIGKPLYFSRDAFELCVPDPLDVQRVTMECLRILQKNLNVQAMFDNSYESEFSTESTLLRSRRFDALFGFKEMNFAPGEFGVSWGVDYDEERQVDSFN